VTQDQLEDPWVNNWLAEMSASEMGDWGRALAVAAILGAAADLAAADPARVQALAASPARESRKLSRRLVENAHAADQWLRAGLDWSWPDNGPGVPLTLARCCLWLGLESPAVARAVLVDPEGVIERASREGLQGAVRVSRQAA